jgi:hypothetical protein
VNGTPLRRWPLGCGLLWVSTAGTRRASNERVPLTPTAWKADVMRQTTYLGGGREGSQGLECARGVNRFGVTAIFPGAQRQRP